jgi:predicted HNH restriction endonuclease
MPSYNKIKYKVKEEIEKPRSHEFLCLNCHKYVHAGDADQHSIEHLSTGMNSVI